MDGPLSAYQYDIPKTLMAMANLRDGGLMIFGVAQDDEKRYRFDGITQANADTFVHETISDHVNRYASPPVDVCVLQVTHESKLVVAAVVSPFARTPIVCRRDTPPSAVPPLKPGEIYVRTSDPVQTTRVMNADMMHDLLELAAGRRAAQTIRTLREHGALDILIDNTVTPQTPSERQGTEVVGSTVNLQANDFDAEIEDIDDIF